MSKITVSLECGCFRRSGMENNKTFENKELALAEANNMLETINETFCHKHNFKIVEDGDNVLIEVGNNG